MIDEQEIDEAWPKFKTVSCPFCSTTLRLIRRGHVTQDGWPRFYYVEKGWADDFKNHTCKDIDTFAARPERKPRRSQRRLAAIRSGPGTLFEQTDGPGERNEND